MSDKEMHVFAKLTEDSDWLVLKKHHQDLEENIIFYSHNGFIMSEIDIFKIGEKYDENGVDYFGWTKEHHRNKHNFNVESLKNLGDVKYAKFEFNEGEKREEIIFSLISIFDSYLMPIDNDRKLKTINIINILKNIPKNFTFNNFDFANFISSAVEYKFPLIKSYKTNQKENIFNYFRTKFNNVAFLSINITLFDEKGLKEEIERENKEHKKCKEERSYKVELCKKVLSKHNSIISNIKTDNVESYAFNDPIKDGQERWVYYHDSWHRMKVSVHKDGLISLSEGNLYAGMTIELCDPDIIEIGAVIRKPNYTPVANN